MKEIEIGAQLSCVALFWSLSLAVAEVAGELVILNQ